MANISIFILYVLGCVSNECTNSTSIRPTLSYQLNDGADYIVNTTRTVATIGTSLSEFIGLFDCEISHNYLS